MNTADGPLAVTIRGFMAIKRHALGEKVAKLTIRSARTVAMIAGPLQTIDGGFETLGAAG